MSRLYYYICKCNVLIGHSKIWEGHDLYVFRVKNCYTCILKLELWILYGDIYNHTRTYLSALITYPIPIICADSLLILCLLYVRTFTCPVPITCTHFYLSRAYYMCALLPIPCLLRMRTFTYPIPNIWAIFYLSHAYYMCALFTSHMPNLCAHFYLSHAHYMCAFLPIIRLLYMRTFYLSHV
jgi:hypothetical protein